MSKNQNSSSPPSKGLLDKQRKCLGIVASASLTLLGLSAALAGDSFSFLLDKIDRQQTTAIKAVEPPQCNIHINPPEINVSVVGDNNTIVIPQMPENRSVTCAGDFLGIGAFKGSFAIGESQKKLERLQDQTSNLDVTNPEAANDNLSLEFDFESPPELHNNVDFRNLGEIIRENNSNIAPPLETETSFDFGSMPNSLFLSNHRSQTADTNPPNCEASNVVILKTGSHWCDQGNELF
ncbi:MAG: hypothetical protein AAGF93_04330 [Cyanobacteria bacterium P01_H01_bin.105]